jgi:hypothetical protein
MATTAARPQVRPPIWAWKTAHDTFAAYTDQMLLDGAPPCRVLEPTRPAALGSVGDPAIDQVNIWVDRFDTDPARTGGCSRRSTAAPRATTASSSTSEGSPSESGTLETLNAGRAACTHASPPGAHQNPEALPTLKSPHISRAGSIQPGQSQYR